ncbi:MAG: hypothetical protein QNJ77_03850 [Acidimicrobiia bacterium]|nr:hypothetical protein [Acidimicrobiia bacterium]
MRYAVIGYVLTYGALVGYVVLLFARLRAAENRVSASSAGEGEGGTPQ